MENKKLILGSGVSSSKDPDAAYAVVLESLKSGIRMFDTAPSYKTEKMLGEMLKEGCRELALERKDIHIQTKIDAWQMQAGNIQQYIEEALQKMQVDYFDALLIHWPVPEYFDNTWKEMAKAVADGRVKKLGICNVRMRQLKRIASLEFQPTFIQIERNPLRTCVKEIDFCHEHGYEVQAYSPLCKMDPRIRDNAGINQLAEKYSKNVGQIVLRWHLDTGVTPVFTSSKPSRIIEYAQLDDFSLTSEDISLINQVNENYKIYLEACACPGF